jgi:signal transduction histidine kinase
VKRVVHELRNHLAIAVANVEAIRDGVLDPSPRRLDAVLHALETVELLLRDLTPAALAAVALLPTHMRRFAVDDLIATEVRGFEAAATGRVIAFTMHRCDAHGTACFALTGDPVRIGEIVNNIITNAVRYTPRGGRIDVDCRRTDASLVLTVTDDGPGVRLDETEKIFAAGIRGSASVGTIGTGSGLALVRRFVVEHGGSIAVSNVPARGARFTVTLPMTHRGPSARFVALAPARSA